MGNYSKYFDEPIEKVLWGVGLFLVLGILTGIISGYILNRIEEKRLEKQI
jgi:NhaP-type Na+/H+ or K+/H+ antiporter